GGLRAHRGLVAEDGRVRTRPLPQRRGAHEPRVGSKLVLAQLPRVEADRAREKLAAALRELIDQARKRRTAVASHALGVTRKRKPHGLLREPDADLLARAEA